MLDTNDDKQWVVANGQQLTIHGLPDGSVQLVGDNGQVAKTVAKGRLPAGCGALALLPRR